MPFVLAAHALGVSPLRIARVHVLPNCSATLRTYLASDAGRNVVHYAALAFLGLGADPTSADWGAMLFEYRMFIFDRPELMLLPGAAITLTSLVLMLLLDRLPRRRNDGAEGDGVPALLYLWTYVSSVLLNLFFAGTLRGMPPILRSDDGRNTVIRPLIYAPEAEIADYAALRRFPIIPCDLCGTQEQLQRKRMKRLLEDLEKEIPYVRSSVLAAMGNVRPSHLADRDLFDFAALGAPREKERDAA